MNSKPKPILLFETICVLNGKAQHLAFHEARMHAAIGLPLLFDLAACVVHKQQGIYRCKVIYDTSGSLHQVAFFPYQKRRISVLKVVETELAYPKKYLDRSALDGLFAARGEADDVLMMHKGLISDTTIANVAILSDGIWITPQTPLLAGTTRARLLQEGKLQARDFGLDELLNASGFALMNAMIGFERMDSVCFQAA